MESSPITLAHTHARNAVLETRRSNPVAASEEHDLAAAEFANAAQKTGNAEALRILHLLEKHHKRFGQLIRFRHEHPELSKKSDSQPESSETIPAEKVSGPPTVSASKPISSPEALQQPPRLAGGPRATARDLSSSIASNLASARGIPGSHRRGLPASPTLSPHHAPGKFSNEQGQPTEEQDFKKKSKLPSGSRGDDASRDDKPSWAPPAHITSSEPTTLPKVGLESATINDAPFQQFYNTIESLMSKLSAPLAFAGLPLTNPATSLGDRKEGSEKAIQSTTERGPEYSQMISRAALRAVQGGQISPKNSNNAAESFYVVPATGGTTSYADIMSRADREASTNPRHMRHPSNLSIDTTSEDFVDAKETLTSSPLSSVPTSQQLGQHQQGKATLYRRSNTRPSDAAMKTINGKTPEELALENMTLRHDFDAVTRRLHVFEASAQQTSAALAHSIRFMARSSNASTPENSHGKSGKEDSGQRRNDSEAGETKKGRSTLELEDLLRRSEAELERRDRENIKLKETVGRYRKKWEALKEGAKARREGAVGAAGGGGGSSNSATPADVTRDTGNTAGGS